MIYPKFPNPGDIIGICAPSAGVGNKLEYFDLSMESLRNRGYEIKETASVRSEDYPSAPADVRGAEFNELFADGSVSMVMSATGGDYNVEMLPYIDQELVRANPKWFAGYSDPTSIEMLLTTKLDIATIYGCNAGAWDWRPLHEFQENSLNIISGNIVEQHSYEFYAGKGFDEEDGDYKMETPVEWTLFVPFEGQLCESYGLDARGRLIGGCIDVLDWIIGTSYEDLQGFAERYKDDGLIWFFDPFEISPLILQYSMNRMKMMGLFDNAQAVVFGRVVFPGEHTDEEYVSQLDRVFRDTNVPIIWGADIGHTKPSMTLINGAMGHLIYDNGKATLSMELR